MDLIIIDDKLGRRPGVSPYLGLQEGMTKEQSIFKACIYLCMLHPVVGKMHP